MTTIEPATLADVEQLVELLALLFVQEADFAPDRVKQRRALEAILAAPQVGQVLVARGEKYAVLGMVSLLASVSTAEGGPVCWLEDMIVRPDARGQGVGSALIEHAIEHARAAGFLRITLLTDRTNASGIRFYERHGFRPSAMTTLRLML